MFWGQHFSYIIIMNKLQKYKTGKKEPAYSVSALQQKLFQQLQMINTKDQYGRNPDYLFDQFEEYGTPNKQVHQPKMGLLNKAKQITYSNKGKIQKMRKEIKKLEETEGAQFMTGVGLFETNQPVQENYQNFDREGMLQSLRPNKGDDLQQLRRMIKKTENNLKMYSHSIYSIQKEVVNAAQKCGRDLDVGLAIKINRCNLDLQFSKPVTKNAQQIRRRTFSSYNPRRSNKQ